MVKSRLSAVDAFLVTCDACGAALPADAQWCGLCHRSFVTAEPLEAPTDARPGWRPATGSVRLHPTRSRTMRSATTFSLPGRIIATVLVLIPDAFFAYSYSLIGLGLWTFVFLPWALRDIWKAVGSQP